MATGMELADHSANDNQKPAPLEGGLELADAPTQATAISNTTTSNPDQAATARKLGQQFNLPTSAVETDVPGFEAQAQRKANAQVIDSNQHIADYLLSSPDAAKISHDDLHQLNDFSKMVSWNPFKLLNPLGEGSGLGHDEALKQRFTVLPLGVKESGGLTLAWPEPLVDSGKLFTDALEGKTPQEVDPDTGIVRPAESEMRRAFDAAMFGIDPAMRMTPVTLGIHAPIDSLRFKATEIEAKQFDDSFKAAEQSKTRERAPDLFEQFTAQMDQQPVNIPAAKVAEIRARDPNAFNYVPDIDKQLAEASVNGGDVSIPASKYFAHTPPELHAEVKDSIRHQAGLSVEEAKTFGEAQHDYTPRQSLEETAAKIDQPSYPVLQTIDEVKTAIEDGSLKPKEENRKICYKCAYEKAQETGSDYAVVSVGTSKGRIYHAVAIDKKGNIYDPQYDHWFSRQAYDEAIGGMVEAKRLSSEQAAKAAEGQETPYLDPARLQLDEKPPEFKAGLPAVIESEATARQRLDVEFPTAPLIRERVMKERKALWLDPIVAPDAAGMSQADFAQYSRHIQELQRIITEGAYRVAEKEISRRQTSEWRDNASRISTELEAQLSLRPDIAADSALRRGVGLDAEAVARLYPDEPVAERLHSQHLKKVGGLDPDAVAELHGFGSGREMIEKLVDLQTDRAARNESPAQQFNRLVEENTVAEMEARFGRLDENVMREALGHAMDVAQVKVLTDELSTLAGGTKLNRQMIEQTVSEEFGSMSKKRGGNIREFERLVAKNGLEAERSLLRGKPNEAFQSKQRQLVNFLLRNEAREFARGQTQLAKTLKRLSSDVSLLGIGQGFVDQLHGLMERVGIYPIPRSLENLTDALNGKGLEDFIREKGDEGVTLADASFLERLGNRPFSEFTVDEARQFKNVVDSLMHAGRDEQKILLAGKAEDRAEVISRITDNLTSMPEKFDPNDVSYKGKLKSLGRGFDATLIKIEQLLDWADHRDPLGPLNQSLWRPLKEAQHLKDDLLKTATDKLKAIDTPKGWRKALKQRVPNKLLLDPLTNRPMPLTRENLVAMMLNSGPENFRKLTEGYEWDPQLVRDFIETNTTEADRKFVDGVKSTFDHFWPEVARVTKELTGVSAERARDYYPLIRDLRRSKLDADLDSFASPAFNPFVQATAFKNRTGAVYPLSLSIDGIPWKLRELVHGIAYKGPVANALKVIDDTRVRRGIDQAFGPEYTDQLKPWLRNIATDGGSPDTRGLAWWNSLSSVARQNAIVTLIGFRASTALIHGGAALSNSLVEAGFRDMMMATTDTLYRNPETMKRGWDWAMENSGELRNRERNLDRDVTSVIDAQGSKFKDYRKAYAIWAMKLVSKLDLASAIPTWIATYKQELTKGLSHEDAVFVADKRIRQAHGSAATMDMAAIQRGTEVEKWFTMFFGYFNHNYNRLRDTGRIAEEGLAKVTAKNYKDAVGPFGKVLQRSIGYLLIPAIIHELVRPHGDDDESWGEWGARAIGTQLVSTIPYLRDVTQALVTHGSLKHKLTSTPLGEAVGGVGQPVIDAFAALDDDPNDKWVQNAIEATGWGLGINTRTTAGWGQFLYDASKGDANDPDYWRLLIEGNPKQRTKH